MFLYNYQVLPDAMNYQVLINYNLLIFSHSSSILLIMSNAFTMIGFSGFMGLRVYGLDSVSGSHVYGFGVAWVYSFTGLRW